VNLPFFIARRYFLSRRKKNFINIISLLSMVGVAIASAALIIVLSVFNGLEELLRSLYSSFDPQLKIEAAVGKSFVVTDSLRQRVRSVEGVDVVTEVIEDYAYIRYREADMVVTLKGVDDSFLQQHRIDERIVQGDLKLKDGDTRYAIVGRGVQYVLTISIEEELHSLQLFYIRNLRGGAADPSQMYNRVSVIPAAVFSIEKNYDDNFIFVPLDVGAELMNYGEKRTALEVKVADNASVSDVQEKLKGMLGQGFSVLNDDEQHRDLYRLLRIEKLFVFLAFSLILFVGSINIFFSLTMLSLDKKKDISVLSAMGARPSLIRDIFLSEGSVISFSGATVGMLLGAVTCWLQMEYGLVSMGMETSVSEGYPVKMKLTDFVLSALVIITVTLLISIRPARVAARFASVRHL
jgi:lipoprotein-releasing system permease protein